MRVNVYAEEMTERIEIIAKEIDGHQFTGLRLYLELPTTTGYDAGGNPINAQGPFIHRPGDDDSAAVTFWGKRDLRLVLRKMLTALEAHYGTSAAAGDQPANELAVRDELRQALGMSIESLRIMQAERDQLRVRLQRMHSEMGAAASAETCHRVMCDTEVSNAHMLARLKIEEANTLRVERDALRQELEGLRAQEPVGHIRLWQYESGAFAWKITGLDSLPNGEHDLYAGPVTAAGQDAAANTRAEER